MKDTNNASDDKVFSVDTVENTWSAEAIADSYAKRVAIAFSKLSPTNLNKFIQSFYLDLKSEIEGLLHSGLSSDDVDIVSIPRFDKSHVFFKLDGIQRNGYVVSGNIAIEYDAQTANVIKMQHLLNIDLIKEGILPEVIERRIILPENEVFRVWKKLE